MIGENPAALQLWTHYFPVLMIFPSVVFSLEVVRRYLCLPDENIWDSGQSTLPRAPQGIGGKSKAHRDQPLCLPPKPWFPFYLVLPPRTVCWCERTFWEQRGSTQNDILTWTSSPLPCRWRVSACTDSVAVQQRAKWSVMIQGGK